MTDIAIIGVRSFLYEKLFEQLKISHQFLSPAILTSPFLPRYRSLLIPTGFANPQYSTALPALRSAKSRIAEFVRKGGVLTIFGPMIEEHDYDWLPVSLKYVCELGSRRIEASDDGCSCILSTNIPECDGYLIPGEGFRTILEDEMGRAVLAIAEFGAGLIVATSIHEFPAAEYIKWALERASPAKL